MKKRSGKLLAAAAAVTASGFVMAPAHKASASPILSTGVGIDAVPAGTGVSVTVNAITGDVTLAFNNIQTRGYEIDSPSGEMNTFDQFDTPPGPAMLLSDGSTPPNDSHHRPYWVELSSDGDPTRLSEGLNPSYSFSTLPTINQSFDLGDIYTHLGQTGDLSVLYADGLGNGFSQSVFYIVPEPTTLGLMGLAAGSLLTRRKRSEEQK